MATVTVTEDQVPLTESEKLQKQKKEYLEKRDKDKPRQSKCNALGTLGKAGLVMALGLLGHAMQDMARLEAEMKRATPPNYVSVPEKTIANMSNYIKELEKSNAELAKARDTLDALLENNPLDSTKPYSIEQRIHKEVKKAAGEEVEDTSKAVVKSKKNKKGGYFNEHFSLNF